MKIYDISLPLSASLPVWPGDPRVDVREIRSMAAGAHSNASHLSCNVHSGTHVDAPSHFIPDGRPVDQTPLEVLIGPVTVCGLPDVDEVSAEDLAALDLPADVQRLLIRTRNSALWAEQASGFTETYVALTPDAARWIVDKGIRLVGVDYLSVEIFGQPEPLTHRALLGAGVVIVEGLDLHQIVPGQYQLACLPLKLVGADGAPARAVLYEMETP